MKILLVPGSLRENSFNNSLIQYISRLNIADVEFKVQRLNQIPMFNEDLEKELPNDINKMIENFEWADAVIISTPEYNNSLPAITRNMLHWLSREYSKYTIKNKPLGITGVTDGGFGTVRAQNELLLMATIIGFKVSSDMRLPISKGQEIFNGEGELVHEKTKEKVIEFVNKFKDWVK